MSTYENFEDSLEIIQSQMTSRSRIPSSLQTIKSEEMCNNTYLSRLSDAKCINAFFESMIGCDFVHIDEESKSFYLYAQNKKGERIVMPETALVMYITYMAFIKPIYKNNVVVKKGASYNTIKRRVMFVSWLHKQESVPSPYTFRTKDYLKKTKRTMAKRGKHVHPKQAKKATSIDIEDAINKIIKKENEQIDSLLTKKLLVKTLKIRQAKIRLTSLRDRTIILIGFHGMCRVSEVASMSFEQLEFSNDALFIKMDEENNKTRNNYRKHILPVENPLHCPIATLRQYIQEANISSGCLFYKIRNKGLDKSEIHISSQTVQRLVKEFLGADKSSHSLRVGMAVAMLEANVPTEIIMNNGGWESKEIMWRYTDQYDVVKHNKSIL